MCVGVLLIDPVIAVVLPADQLMLAKPQGDLSLGALNRVTAMDHIPVRNKQTRL